MMKNLLIFGLLLGCTASLWAQERMWIFLNDKGENMTERLSHPGNLLSPEALERREKAGIGLNASDLPVWQAYVDELEAQSLNILSTSRWLNAVAVEMPEGSQAAVNALSFVKNIQPIRTLVQTRSGGEDNGPISPRPAPLMRTEGHEPFAYGEAEFQNSMLNIPAFHQRGFTGKGVKIALFDSGFSGADTIDAFDSLWAQNRIIAWYDFVDDDTTVFTEDSHGTQVMSTIGANLPGEMVGTAPHASFILCRTENARSETLQEEHNWVKALEWVDSLGVDVIHSSLGYSEFDDSNDDYTYEQMDGKTAVVTRAADHAASKGILVTTSAGNEGYGSWKYITAPCDGDSVLCVGSVSKNGKKSGFSSVGPSADGRIKPDVVALGSRATVASPRNYISSADGTSFSGPIIGGVVACLKQAHPDRPNMDIILAMKMSGDQYIYPDNEYGYGIPDVVFADSLLTHVEDLSTVEIQIASKPIRGEKPKVSIAPVVVPIIFAADPVSTLSADAKSLNLLTTSQIEEVKIMQDHQTVYLDPKDIKASGQSWVYISKYLEPGEYYLSIKTADYEENIKFSMP